MTKTTKIKLKAKLLLIFIALTTGFAALQWVVLIKACLCCF